MGAGGHDSGKPAVERSVGHYLGARLSEVRGVRSVCDTFEKVFPELCKLSRLKAALKLISLPRDDRAFCPCWR